MSSLPIISHHLFVAAAGQDGQTRRQPVRREPPRPIASDDVETAPLHLVGSGEPRGAERASVLRLAVAWGES